MVLNVTEVCAVAMELRKGFQKLFSVPNFENRTKHTKKGKEQMACYISIIRGHNQKSLNCWSVFKGFQEAQQQGLQNFKN